MPTASVFELPLILREKQITMTIKLSLKRPKSTQSVIIAEFKKNNQKYRFYTGKSIFSSNWSKKGVVKAGENNFELLNEYIKVWLAELKQIIAKIEINKEILDQKTIQEKLNEVMKQKTQKAPILEKTEDQKDIENVTDFISFMTWYIANKKDTVRNTQKLNQTKKLVIVGFNLISKKHLAEYEDLSIKEKSLTNLNADIKFPFDQINLEFVERFRNNLFNLKYSVKENKVLVFKNYKINYIDKQVKGLKQFLLSAISKQFVKHFTWNEIKTEEKEVDSVFTDFNEIQELYDTLLTHPTEIRVRDKYVFNCFLGLRYIDLNDIEPHSFKSRTIKGEDYMVYCGRSHKSDNKVEFVVHPIAVSILEKYDYKMPKLSAKEYNEVLKRVSEKAGFTHLERIREFRGKNKIILDIPKFKLMSSHAGRRSFCTNFYNEGVAIGAIMSISGHKTEEEFRKYIKKPQVRIEIVAQQVTSIKGISHLRIA